jgi:hypothetical protein
MALANASVQPRGIIHNWAMSSDSRVVNLAGFVYNRLKDGVGLQAGLGSLIDPSAGRARIYQGKLIDLAAARLQKRLEGGPMAYLFKNGQEHPALKGLSKDDLKTLLGGKGYGLYKMIRLGLPVPTTVTLPAWLCSKLERGKLTAEQRAVIDENLKLMEEASGKKFGDESNPLFVSCRSGAK